MVEGGGGARFTLEPFERLGVSAEGRGKKFQGDAASEMEVFGFVDDAHAARAESLADVVVGDACANQVCRREAGE